MNNYPPGAENDPNAPYNQQDPPEVEVTVTETLEKKDVVFSYGGHYCCDTEFDLAEGRVIHTQYYDPGDVEADWKEQRRSAEQCLHDAERVLKALIEEKKPRQMYAGVNIVDLYDDCSGWEQISFNLNS